MCVIQEVGARAKEYAHSLLTAGIIEDEMFQAVLDQLKEQLALCATAMMAEVRLRTNAIVSEKTAMEQIGRELMNFIASREQEQRRRRRKATGEFGKIRERQPVQMEAPARYESPGKVVKFFLVRYPDAEADRLAGFSH